jgi:hypothetical protein
LSGGVLVCRTYEKSVNALIVLKPKTNKQIRKVRDRVGDSRLSKTVTIVAFTARCV